MNSQSFILWQQARATASLVWSLEAENEAPPKPGRLSAVANWEGEPLCVIETKAVEVVPFKEATAGFAAMEGEADKSRRYWREVHWEFFGRECLQINRTPNMLMPVLCEQFTVIYQPTP